VSEASRQRALETLLAGFSANRFLNEFYGRLPLHVASANRRRFESLIHWAELERLLNMVGCWDDTRLRLVAEGRRLSPEQYCFARTGTDNEARVWRPQPERVMAAMNAGATLVLNGLDGLVPAIGATAHDLEVSLNVRVQSNLYLSRRGQRGLPLHYDVHDVLALQISGQKHWRLYQNPAHPGARVPPERELRARAGPVSQTIQLSAGDLLYLPAGVVHEAIADSDHSMHLTLALKQVTLLDVASLMMKHLAASDDASTPRYDLHLGRDALARHAAQLAERFATLAADPTATAAMLADIEANRLPRGQYRLGPARPQPELNDSSD